MKLIDRLAEIRRQQRDLRAEALQLRQRLLAGEALVGDEYVASIERHITVRRMERAGNGASHAETHAEATRWMAV